MILDSYGTPLQRAIGFVGGYVRVPGKVALVGTLYVVGVEVSKVDEDEDEDCSACAPPLKRQGALGTA